jgi:hypothetical protein
VLYDVRLLIKQHGLQFSDHSSKSTKSMVGSDLLPPPMLKAAAAASFFWHIADGLKKKVMNCEALAPLRAIAEGHE